MTFFLNDQPPEQSSDRSSEGEALEQATSHSPRSKPLFKQDTTLPESLSGQHISLSAYISKHLENQEQAPAEEIATAVPASWSFAPPKPKRPPGGEDGQYLNSLDVELAAGLEQYLPTPLFRLRVMKKRLDGEINELRMRLNKYSRLPNPSQDMKDRAEAVRARLATLEAHERQVSLDLASAMAFGPLMYKLSQGSQDLGDSLGGFRKGFQWLRSFVLGFIYGKTYLALETEGKNLRNLQELFSDRLKDKTTSSAELGQILNRYEQMLRQIENQAEQLKPRSFPWRLWQQASRLVK